MPLDPDARNLIELIKSAGRPPLDQLEPAQAREAYVRASALFAPAPPPTGPVTDLSFPGPGGPVRARVYRGTNAPAQKAPALLYLHGGGWVIGDLDTHDYLCRKFANDAACVVVAVDYRLAPEHRFPAAVEDSQAAAQWLAAQADELGVDAGRLAVGGDSAGGNLSAVLAIMGRDTQAPSFCLQMLLYPAVDASMRHESYRTIAPDMPLNRDTVRYFLDHYASGVDTADWRLSPARAARFDGLPPAFVLTARYDPLCDEGREYARTLEAAGVRVWSVDFNDQIHGFLTNGKAIPAAETALDMAASALRYAFALAARKS